MVWYDVERVCANVHEYPRRHDLVSSVYKLQCSYRICDFRISGRSCGRKCRALITLYVTNSTLHIYLTYHAPVKYILLLTYKPRHLNSPQPTNDVTSDIKTLSGTSTIRVAKRSSITKCAFETKTITYHQNGLSTVFLRTCDSFFSVE